MKIFLLLVSHLAFGFPSPQNSPIIYDSSCDSGAFNIAAQTCLGPVEIDNVAFVNNVNGDDDTCLIGDPNYPCQDIGTAMQLFTNLVGPGSYFYILLQAPGTYPLGGVNWLESVTIVGLNENTTTLDMQVGIDMDSSWGNEGGGVFNIGGMANVSLITSSRNTNFIFDFSAFSSQNVFNFLNVFLPGYPTLGGMNLELIGNSQDPSEIQFNLNRVFQSRGDLDLTDNMTDISDYFNLGGNINAIASNVNGGIIVDAGNTIATNLTVEGDNSGSAFFMLFSGAIGGEVNITSSTSQLMAQLGALPSEAYITNSGGTLSILGDAYQVPYYPATPSNWNYSPISVTDVLDQIASGSFNTVGYQLNTSGSQPTCSSSTRGLLWLKYGASGVADIFQICEQTVSGYSWITH